MNELELTRALYLQLAEEEQRLVVKRAAEKGFVVDGFSKNVSKAPPRAVCACMAKRARRGGKYPYQLVLGAMAERRKINEENIIYNLAGEWMKGEYTHAGVEEYLKNLTHDKKEPDSAAEKSEPEIKLQEQEQNQRQEPDSEAEVLKKEIQRLEQELTTVKEKNKKYKNTIQENKIEIDNLQKNILRQEKAKDRLFRQIGELEHQIEQIQAQKQEEITRREMTEQRTIALGEQIETLMEQIKELELYRKHAPKLLCIAKTKNKIDIPGYDIKMVHEWDEMTKDEAVNGGYLEVWLVQKQFPYHLVSEMSECIGKRLRQFLTMEDLINTVCQGGKEDDADGGQTDYRSIG